MVPVGDCFVADDTCTPANCAQYPIALDPTPTFPVKADAGEYNMEGNTAIESHPLNYFYGVATTVAWIMFQCIISCCVGCLSCCCINGKKIPVPKKMKNNKAYKKAQEAQAKADQAPSSPIQMWIARAILGIFLLGTLWFAWMM
jgi:hypothetical protein